MNTSDKAIDTALFERLRASVLCRYTNVPPYPNMVMDILESLIIDDDSRVAVQFDIRLLSDMRSEVIKNTANPSVAVVIGTGSWSTLIADKSFASIFDPEVRYENVQMGILGAAFAMPVISDCFISPEIRPNRLDKQVCVVELKNEPDGVRPGFFVWHKIR